MVREHGFQVVLACGLAFIASMAMAIGAEVASENVVVSARGLDLRTPAGAARLRTRVVIAAHKMCGKADGLGGIGTDAFSDCVTEAVQDAKTQAEAMIAAARLARPAMLASGVK